MSDAIPKKEVSMPPTDAGNPTAANDDPNNNDHDSMDDDDDEIEADLANVTEGGGGASIPMPPKPTQDLIDKCRLMTLADIGAVDKAFVERGMALFFTNQYVEAEAVFRQKQGEDPLVAACSAILYAMRAVLSMEQQYISQACTSLVFASHFAKNIVADRNKSLVSSAFSGVSKWFKAPAEIKPMSSAAFRASVVMAEAEVLRGIVLLLEESFSSYIKAGLALRRSYNIYDSLQKHLEAYQAQQIKKGALKQKDVDAAVAAAAKAMSEIGEDGGSDESVHSGLGEENHHYKTGSTATISAAKARYGIDVDNNSYYAMHFGLGCIHIATSILPEKVLAVLSRLGYMHDRKKGFAHMNECLMSGTIRAPLASLFLMGFHGVLPAFSPLMLKDSLPAAARVDRAVKRLFPKSVVHLWISGRVNRLARGTIVKPPPTSATASVASSSAVVDEETNDDVRIFQRCVYEGSQSSLATALPQLKDFALYDLAWSFVARMEWYKAALCFKVLEETSMWSKRFYGYAQGCCWEMCGNNFTPSLSPASAAAAETSTDQYDIMPFLRAATTVPTAPLDGELQASQCYWRCISYKTVKLGGKEISVDQFVAKRVKRMMELGKRVHEAMMMGSDGSTSTCIGGTDDASMKKFGGPYILKNTTIAVSGLEVSMLFSIVPEMRFDALKNAQKLLVSTLQLPLLKDVDLRPTAKELMKKRGKKYRGNGADDTFGNDDDGEENEDDDGGNDDASSTSSGADVENQDDDDNESVVSIDDNDNNDGSNAATTANIAGGGTDLLKSVTSSSSAATASTCVSGSPASPETLKNTISIYNTAATTFGGGKNNAYASYTAHGYAVAKKSSQKTAATTAGSSYNYSPASAFPSAEQHAQYLRLFRKHNEALKEDMAVLVLLYANVSRELLRMRDLLVEAAQKEEEMMKKHPSTFTPAFLGKVPLTLPYTYDDCMHLYNSIILADDDATKQKKKKKKERRNWRGKKVAVSQQPSSSTTAGPTRNDVCGNPTASASATAANHPIDPRTSLLVIPNLGLHKMTSYSRETWVLPHAIYETAIVKYFQQCASDEVSGSYPSSSTTTSAASAASTTKKASSSSAKPQLSEALALCKHIMHHDLKQAVGGRDYSFEMVMQFRLHLANGVLKGVKH